THAFGEVWCGAEQDVMGRLEPGQVIRRIARLRRAETQKGVQMVRFAAYRLDSQVQLAAIDIAHQTGRSLAFDDAPENAIEQRPAIIAAKARSHLQFGQQLPRDTYGARRITRLGQVRALREQAAWGVADQPLDLMGLDARGKQIARERAPFIETAIEAHLVHHHSAICRGPSPSRWRRAVESWRARRGR